MSFSYAKLTEPQKRQWHAEVYAMRRVLLGVPRDVHTSPPDPKGIWYNERDVADTEAAMRTRIAEQSQRCQADTATRNAGRFRDGAAGKADAGYAEAAE